MCASHRLTPAPAPPCASRRAAHQAGRRAGSIQAVPSAVNTTLASPAPYRALDAVGLARPGRVRGAHRRHHGEAQAPPLRSRRGRRGKAWQRCHAAGLLEQRRVVEAHHVQRVEASGLLQGHAVREPSVPWGGQPVQARPGRIGRGRLDQRHVGRCEQCQCSRTWLWLSVCTLLPAAQDLSRWPEKEGKGTRKGSFHCQYHTSRSIRSDCVTSAESDWPGRCSKPPCFEQLASPGFRSGGAASEGLGLRVLRVRARRV